MNNFYASVECMLDPSLRKYPVAVCGSVEERHGIVLAKNYAATSTPTEIKRDYVVHGLSTPFLTEEPTPLLYHIMRDTVNLQYLFFVLHYV